MKTLRPYLLAALFGLVFGFLIQKGGAAKFHVLVGVLLLEDLTVIKLMLSAIVVGMIGVFPLNALGKVEEKAKPLILGATLIGGLLFGAGFALSGYCPGTAAAALGQGNGDALFSILGLVAGSYLYAVCSGPLGRTVKTWGDRGKPLLPDLVRLPRPVFVGLCAVILVGVLVLLEVVAER
ncbi:MAG: YeeE/YedE thiosulfate transporter family protein [Verrucomicrobiota bacterium]